MTNKEKKKQAPLGYTDTPMLPNSQYRVHDINRPQPPVVTPGIDAAGGQPGMPPSDAVVLFDGSDLSKWIGKEGKDAPWKIEDGYMEVVPKSGDIKTREAIGDCQLHVEWAAPAQVKGDSQGRGNSGIFLMDLYEIQVLDCCENRTYADGMTGAVYGQWPPLVNACRKPGQWQSYDIIWQGPRFEDQELVEPAYMTVFLNRVLLHHHTKILGPTRHKKVTEYKPHPPEAPLRLQDHKNPVRFRNVWYRPLSS